MRFRLRFAATVVSLAVLGSLLLASLPTVPSGSWAATGSLASPRLGAAATLLYDGRVLITGGVSQNGAVTASVERYTPDGGAFLSTPQMPTARANHSATLLPDGRVLVAGGVGEDGRALTTAEIYDPSSNSWTAAGSMYVARAGHTATPLHDGRIIVAGGSDAGVSINAIEAFDPAAGSFQLAAATLTSPRASHAAALLPSGSVLITGGFDGTNLLSSVDTYDPFTDAIVAGPSLATARANHSATTLLSGKVLIAGGVGAGGDLASAEVFDPATGTFHPSSSAMLTARQGHQAVLLPHNNQVLIVGGTSNGAPATAAEHFVEWQGSLGMFFATTAPATPRAWATANALSLPASATLRTGPSDGLLLFAGGGTSASMTSATASSDLYGFATVNTDWYDYSPGMAVAISGGGWVSGESVALTLDESPFHHTHALSPVTADGSGHIASTQFVPGEDDIGMLFRLTAIGSVSQARTTFTDSRNLAISFSGSGNGSVVIHDTTDQNKNRTCTGPATCLPNLGANDVGTLTAAPDAGSVFAGWSSASSGVTGCAGATCDFALGNGLQSVEATFLPATTLTVTTASGKYGTSTRSIKATLKKVAGGTAISGKTISFALNGTTVGTAVTNTSGVATLTSANLLSPVKINTGRFATGVSASFAGDATFAPSSATNTLTVSKQAITVTAVTNAKTYDGTTTATGVPTITSGSLVPGDSATWSETYSNKHAGIGTKTLVPRGVVSDDNGGSNYTVKFVNFTAGTIEPRPITVTATTNTKTYDGTLSAAAVPTITTGILAQGDSATWSESYADKHIGTGDKTLIPKGTISDGNSGHNYAVTFVNDATGTIQPRPITVTAATNTKTYDKTTAATRVPAITSGSLATGDSAVWSEVYADWNAGTGNKTLIPSGTVADGNGGNNYTVTFVDCTTGTINRRSITVTAAANAKTYDGTTSADGVPTVTSGSLAAGDSASWSQVYSTRHAGTGNRTLIPSGSVSDGNGGANYSVRFVNFTGGTIDKLPVTVTAVSDTKEYDGTTSATGVPTMTSGSLAPGDSATWLQAYSSKHAGTGNKTLVPSGSISDGNGGRNYAVTFVPFTAGTITQRPITVTAVMNTKTYDGTTTATRVPTITLGVLAPGDSARWSEAYADKHVGTANKTLVPGGVVNDGNGGNNYSVTFVTFASGTINKRSITVTAAANVKTYDGTTSADAVPAITSGSLAPGDSAVWSEAYSNGSIGTGNRTLVPTGTVSDGNEGENYAVRFVNVRSGTITPAPLTVTGVTAADKVYDGLATATLSTANAQLVGVVGSDVVSLNSGGASAAFEDGNAGASKPVTTSGFTIAGANASSYTLSQPALTADITARVITVTADPKTKTYGAGDPLLTYIVTTGALVGSDTLSGSLARSAGEAVGSYPIHSTLANHNYAITFVGAQLTITARALTGVITADDKPYDGTAAATVHVSVPSGVVNGDSVAVLATSAVFDNADVGSGKPVTSHLSLIGVDSANYTINPTAATTASITAVSLTASFVNPANGATNVDMSQPITWTAVGAEVYYLYIGTTPGAKDLVDTGGLRTTSYTASSLPADTPVYARLWTKMNGVWRYVDITFTPSGPTLAFTYPAPNVTSADMRQPFAWSAVPGAEAYYLWVGTTVGTSNVTNSGELHGTSYLATNLPVGQILYARLWVKVGGLWSYVDRTITSTATATSIAQFIHPTNGATNVNLGQSITWTAVQNAQMYYLWVGTTFGSSDLINSGALTTTSYLATQLPTGQLLYARLWTEFGNVWRYTDISFTATQTGVTLATMITPANGATGVSPTAVMTWNSVPGAQMYYVWAGSTPGAQDLIDSEGICDTCKVSPMTTSWNLSNGGKGPGLGSFSAGQVVYLRLWTMIGDVWRYTDATFTIGN